MFVLRQSKPTFGIMFDKPDDSGASTVKLTKLIESLGDKVDGLLPDEAIQSLQSLAKRSNEGDVDPLHKILFNENFQLRKKLKESEIGEDASIVTKDQKELLDKLEENEIKSVKEFESIVTERDEAKNKLSETQREMQIGTVASIYGAKENVIKKLIPNAEFEIGKQKNDEGEEVDVVFVLHGDDKKEKTEFSKYVDSELAEFKPSLFSDSDDNSQNTGRKFVKQKGSSTPNKKGGAVKSFLEQRNKRAQSGNALKPKQESKTE